MQISGRRLHKIVPFGVPLFLCLLAACSTDLPSVYDFEDGKLPSTIQKKVVKDYSAVVQSDIVRSGKYAVRFELREGDLFRRFFLFADGYRAEFRDRFNAEVGKDCWYGLSLLLPKDFPIHNNRLVLAQWKGQADVPGEEDRSPALALRFRNGVFFVTVEHCSIAQQRDRNCERKTIYETKKFPLGVWNDFVFHIKWSYQTDGYVHVWQNGKQLIEYSGPVGFNDKEGPYFKFGLYRDDVPETYVAYFDEYRRGSSFSEVDPSAKRLKEK